MKKMLFKLFIILLFFTISFIITIKHVDSIKLDLDKNTIDILLESSNNIDNKNRIVNELVNTIKKADIINPVSSIINHYNKDDTSLIVKTLNEEKKVNQNNKKTVYIYNTHQGEKYISTKDININYSVMDASFYLQKRLKTYGIESIVETSSIEDVLDTNNWNYASSYRVSRMYLEKRKQENKDLVLYIDLHRDSVSKNISTININNKPYAKTMFLLGLENENFQDNKIVLNKLENWLNDNYKGLSRGIYEKKGKGVNGVYNQDFSKYCILIEIGGEENTYEEVENTIDVIAEMIKSNFGDELV